MSPCLPAWVRGHAGANVRFRKYFPPGQEGDEKDGEAPSDVDDAADNKKGATVSDLPDVPTDEPKELGQPDHKKAKLDEG